MNTTVGTCSLCGGRVSVPVHWMSTIPPVPTCESCGATQKQPHGNIVEMEPRQHQWQFYANGSFCERCGAAIGSGVPCK